MQRNFINKDGVPTHKFESRNNIGRFYLDFKSLTLKQVNEVIERIDFVPKVFFDRVSPAILKLATTFKEKGTVIFFEPSSRGGNVSLFNKCVEVSDIAYARNSPKREWLVSKFGADGQYQDVLGLCKIATIQEIEEKNYSLTSGAYVGVVKQEDDGMDFHERMTKIHAELTQLNSTKRRTY